MCRSESGLQSDDEPGPSVSGVYTGEKFCCDDEGELTRLCLQSATSPRRVSRLLHICPKIFHRSPSTSHDSSPAKDAPSTGTRPMPGRPTSLSRDLMTPGRRLRVYDDLISPSRQPQTPEQLPEARHQSILPESYTAPVGRFRVLQAASRTPSTLQRVRHRREPSPTGMRTPGFEGLYGGRENGDDVALFDEASEARQGSSPS